MRRSVPSRSCRLSRVATAPTAKSPFDQPRIGRSLPLFTPQHPAVRPLPSEKGLPMPVTIRKLTGRIGAVAGDVPAVAE